MSTGNAAPALLPQALVVAALGALQTLAFVHTALWWLPILCMAVLAALVWRAAPLRAALLGWLFGSAWLGAGVWWLFISLHRYGGLAAWLAVLAVALLCMALSLYLAAAMALFARWRRGRVAVDAALFAVLWLLAELARTVIFTGFPWLASGYAQIDGPLAAWAPWIGVSGIGMGCALLAALLASAWHLRVQPRQALAALAVAGLVPLLSAAVGTREFSQPVSELSVSLLQGNVSQDQKFAAEHMPQALAWMAHAVGIARGELVMAPETAVPLLPEQLAELVPGYWPALRARFETSAQAGLIGVPLGDYRSGYTNSVLGLSAARLGGDPYRYDKVHLVPFGEFIPTGFRWFTEMMNIPLGDFARGPRNAPSFKVGRERIAPNICYEDLFGAELARRFIDPALAPTIFANVSNIGWFGDTIAVDQHLHISRMRTLEFQRPMLRATNTGATAIIDHRAQLVAKLPPFTRGVLEGRVQGREGLTPFAWWSARFGLWPWLVLAGLVIALCLSVPRAPARPDGLR
ncbi:MAG TPA: apolipoprotein N-acyltransferase [Rubrivivax sp.]|nr:apolipoprotein N-acyltransferase [Rubrivivax sp.]